MPEFPISRFTPAQSTSAESVEQSHDSVSSGMLGGRVFHIGTAISPHVNDSITAGLMSRAIESDKRVNASADTISALVDVVRTQTGIVPSHLEKLLQVAVVHDCVIAVRPVDRMATALIEAGHPTKDFHIKGKSASWGPQAGMICVDQNFSKLEGGDAKEIAGFNEEIAHSLKPRGRGAPPFAVQVPLTLSRERLSALLASQVITAPSHTDNEHMPTHLEAIGPSGKKYIFAAKLESSGRYAITRAGKPLYVLAPKVGALPLTADYDLMFVAPRMDALGPQDNLPVPTISHRIFRSRLNHYKRISHSVTLLSYLDKNTFYAGQDPDKGNVSPRVGKMIGVINQALGCPEGLEVVHHGADSSNPATQPKTNYPLTIFLPHPIGNFKRMMVIHHVDELKQLLQSLKDEGYQPPINPLWESSVNGMVRRSFTEASRELKKRYSVTRE